MPNNLDPNTEGQLPDGKTRHTRSALDNYTLSDHSWMEFPPNPYVDDPNLHDKCLQVVELLKKFELDFGEFVWAVCFGNHASRACKKMQAARSSFIKGNYLVPLLENIRIPPRTEAKGKRPDSAKDTLDRFALATMCSTFQQELTSYGSIPPVHIRDFIDPERLGAMSYAKLKKQVEDHCPTLFKVLHYLSSFNRQKRSLGNANTKNSEFVSVAFTNPG